MAILVDLVTLSDTLHLCLSQISCIASDFLDFPDDEQKFKLGRCVGGCKTPISCTNILIVYKK
jgi:hypothetical protein